MIEVFYPCSCAWKERGCLGLPDHKAHQWYSRLLPGYKELLLKEEEFECGGGSENNKPGGKNDHIDGSDDDCSKNDGDVYGGNKDGNREYGFCDGGYDNGGGYDDYDGTYGDNDNNNYYDDDYDGGNDDYDGGNDDYDGGNDDYDGGNDNDDDDDYEYHDSGGGNADYIGGGIDGGEGHGKIDYDGRGYNGYDGRNYYEDYVQPFLLRNKPKLAPKPIGPYSKDGRGSCVVYQADVAAGGCGYVTGLSKPALVGKRKRSVE